MTKDYSNYIDRRQAMVKVISEALGIPSKYMKVPTCAYQIGPVKVTKDATLETADEDAGQKAAAALAEHGFIAVGETGAEPQAGMTTKKDETPTVEQDRPDALTVSVPRNQLDDDALERLRKMVDANPVADPAQETGEGPAPEEIKPGGEGGDAAKASMLFYVHPFEAAVTNRLMEHEGSIPEKNPESNRILAAQCYERLKSVKDAF